MTTTNAERQAAHRAKVAEKTTFLETENAALKAENADLRKQLDKATVKAQALQKKVKKLQESA